MKAEDKLIKDLKSEIAVLKRDNKFLRSSLEKISVPKKTKTKTKSKSKSKTKSKSPENDISSKIMSLINNASTGQKIAAGTAVAAGSSTLVALLAKLASDQLAKKNQEENEQPPPPPLQPQQPPPPQLQRQPQPFFRVPQFFTPRPIQLPFQ